MVPEQAGTPFLRDPSLVGGNRFEDRKGNDSRSGSGSLDTKPPCTCNGKSSTKNCSYATYPFLGYGRTSQPVVLAKRLCIFALC